MRRGRLWHGVSHHCVAYLQRDFPARLFKQFYDDWVVDFVSMHRKIHCLQPWLTGKVFVCRLCQRVVLIDKEQSQKNKIDYFCNHIELWLTVEDEWFANQYDTFNVWPFVSFLLLSKDWNTPFCSSISANSHRTHSQQTAGGVIFKLSPLARCVHFDVCQLFANSIFFSCHYSYSLSSTIYRIYVRQITAPPPPS